MRTIPRAAAPPVPAAFQEGSRDGDGDGDGGLAWRVDLAERRLADAYDHAAAAGVRPGILRGYRREWDRARREAAGQPRAALRLYAMMTSDVDELADDAAAVDDGFPR